MNQSTETLQGIDLSKPGDPQALQDMLTRAAQRPLSGLDPELARLADQILQLQAAVKNQENQAAQRALAMQQQLGALAGHLETVRQTDESRSWRMEIPDAKVAAGAGGPAPDHSWRFEKTAPTEGTVTLGLVLLAGVNTTVTDWPTDGKLTGVTASVKYWLEIDVSAETATWVSGTDWGTSTGTMEVWPLLEITCVGGAIASYIERETSDVHITKLA